MRLFLCRILWSNVSWSHLKRGLGFLFKLSLCLLVAAKVWILVIHISHPKPPVEDSKGEV